MTVHAVKTIGIIGLGKMGDPIARHLSAKGFSVSGYDVSPAAISRAEKHGVRIAGSPAALTAVCDLVIVVTAFESQVEEVLFGSNGVVE